MAKNKIGERRRQKESRIAEVVARKGTYGALDILPKSPAAIERIVTEASKNKKSADDPAQERMEEVENG